MDFKKQNIQNYFLYDTRVDNLFISEYMPGAPQNAVKVYLLAAMDAEAGIPSDAEGLAKKLRISVTEVEEAWDYWVKQGIVRKTVDPSMPGKYGIELLNIREIVFGRRLGNTAPAQEGPFALDDAAYSELLRNIEVQAGRLLEAGEPQEIALWVSQYGMSPEVILLGYKYSTEKGKSNRYRYVGAILKDWRAKGYTTAAQVEDALGAEDRHYNYYRAVMKELGFHRNASEPEKRIIDSWFDKLGFSLDEVKDACKKTTGISNPNINYLNTILVGRYNEKNQKPEEAAGGDIFSRVEALYEKTRQENEAKTARIREEIFARVPRIKEIEAEIRNCGFAVSKAMLGKAGQAEVNRLKGRMEALGREKNTLLAENGYAANALEAIYDCPECRDTGILDDGSRCPCYKEKTEALLKENGR